MPFITYVRDAVRPGGTPTRYLIWVCVILLAQTLASVLPSPRFYTDWPNMAHYILAAIVCAIGAVLFLRTDRHRILAAYALYIAGLALSTVTISLGITSLSGIIFMLTWAMTLFIAERREYISFYLVTLFMVLMLVSTIILLMFNPTMDVADNIVILATGALLTGINIYLVYADFGIEKNYYQESRKIYKELEILTNKMSEILASRGELEELLWKVSQECIPLLDLEDCVIYLYDEKKNRLIQTAAYGNKYSEQGLIENPIELEPSRGIVGRCFRTGQTVLVPETRLDPDYIVDDAARNSELAVPIVSDGKVVGIIDSEHHQKGHFRERHVRAFHIIASYCGIKITEQMALRSILQAEEARSEALRYKELDELKNRFITNISHDLKTPLSLIKGPAAQIARLATDPMVVKQSGYILKNTEHLLRVVNQLLQLNRVDRGLNELYLEEVHTDQLLSKVAGQYTGLAERDEIDFTVGITPVTLLTDSFRLEQIVHNLLHNAFRYTGPKGRIALWSKADKDELLIEIQDSGPGIAPEMQSKVFDRFFKVDVNNHEGTGIGLSLVKEYVQSLSGTISLHSSPGEGTVFTVRLPLQSAVRDHRTEIPSEVAVEETDGKPYLLVVEDHADLNNFICSYFENDFYCISAFDGAEALRKMDDQMPDVIISDLMMPNMDGNTFVEQVKSSDAYGHIPVIVLSAKSQTESRVDLYGIGADNYLVKPFDVTELDAVIRNVLEQRRKLYERFRSRYLEQAPAPIASLPDTAPANAQHPLLEQAIVFVKNHLDDSSLSIGAIAEALGIGRNRFQKEIRELTQLTPVEFVRSVRLHEARSMLQNRSLHVSEVAYAVGFNNLSYFSRSFKAEFGVLPSEWQESTPAV